MLECASGFCFVHRGPTLFRQITRVRECRCTWPLTRFDSSRPSLCYARRQPLSLILDPQGRDFIHKSGDEGPRHANLSLSLFLPPLIDLARFTLLLLRAHFPPSRPQRRFNKIFQFRANSRRCRCHSNIRHCFPITLSCAALAISILSL